MPAKARNMAVHFSSENHAWGTPRPFYTWADLALGFTLDVCASPENAKAPRYFSEKDNGLAQSWKGSTWWMNPPYGDQLPEWMRRGRHAAMREAAPGACLVPSRVDTDWWRKTTQGEDFGALRRSWYVPRPGVLWLEWSRITVGIYHHDQRLMFEGMKTKNGQPTGAPFPSSLLILLPPRLRRLGTVKWPEPLAPVNREACRRYLERVAPELAARPLLTAGGPLR